MEGNQRNVFVHPDIMDRKDKIFLETDLAKRKTKIVCTLG